MGDDEVFAEIARLVAAGEYRDRYHGRAGFDLEGDPGEIGEWPEGELHRIYHRRSARYATARANGWLEPLPPLAPAAPELVEEVEATARRKFPPLLRRLYLEVANGGFGPEYGIKDLWAGHPLVTRERSVAGRARPRIARPLCSWFNGGLTEIDLFDGQVWGTTAYAVPTGIPHSYPQGLTVTEWLARWLEGRAYPPLLVRDGAAWRPGTEAEERAAFEEREENRRNPEPFQDDEDWPH
nr:hypothetical protein GCM10020063_020610 [Dactylosporangium thailandense]